MLAAARRPLGYTPRRAAGLAGYERVLAKAGLSPVAGIDEAGRGACAGPLVVAAVVLDLRAIAAITDLADSKALSAQARDASYQQIVASALAWHVVVIPAAEIDRTGLHVCNVSGMRRALAGLPSRPGYVLTDGFPVRGLAVPALAMWKGDQVAACVAAASVIAKVTRDRIMRGLHMRYPQYGFSRHKGYSTPGHMRALDEHGPSPEHRRSFANVRQVGAPCPESDLQELAADPALACFFPPAAAPEPARPAAGPPRATADGVAPVTATGTAAGATPGPRAGENGRVVSLNGNHARRGTVVSADASVAPDRSGEHERGGPREVRDRDGASALP